MTDNNSDATGGPVSERRKALIRDTVAVVDEVPGLVVEQGDPDRDRLVLRHDDGRSTVLMVANLDERIGDATGDARRRVIHQFVLAAVEVTADSAAGEDWTTVRNLMLRTTLAPSHHHAVITGKYGQGGLVGVEVLPGIAEVAALDRPGTVEIVDRKKLQVWQASADEVLAAARRNMRDAPDPGRWRRIPGTSLWQLENADFFSCARLLRPGYVAKHAPAGRGQLIFVVPTRDQIVAGWLPELTPMLNELCAMALKVWEEAPANNRISPVVYTVDRDGRIAPLHVETGPARDNLHAATIHLAMHEYAMQAQHGKPARTDDHWADLHVVKSEDGGSARSTAVIWNGTAGDLLPVAELVIIPGVAGEASVIRWADMREVASVESAETMPERWRTTAPLTAAEHAELTRRAVRRMRLSPT